MQKNSRELATCMTNYTHSLFAQWAQRHTFTPGTIPETHSHSNSDNGLKLLHQPHSNDMKEKKKKKNDADVIQFLYTKWFLLWVLVSKKQMFITPMCLPLQLQSALLNVSESCTIWIEISKRARAAPMDRIFQKLRLTNFSQLWYRFFQIGMIICGIDLDNLFCYWRYQW